MRFPVTPDRRYFVVRGRLWRLSDPSIDPARHDELTKELMAARRDVGRALRAGGIDATTAARRRVDVVKHQLGERGPVWWTDGTPDYNRRMVKNTPYADWFSSLT